MRNYLVFVICIIFSQPVFSQCPDVYATRKKVSSSFHSSLMIDYNGSVKYWGETSNPTTGATTATPGTLSTSLYAGTPLAVAASSIATGTNGHQMYLLTTDSLYGWGSISGSATFTSLSKIGLPTTLSGSAFAFTAANIEFITASGGGLAIVAKIGGGTNGEVFIKNPSGTGGGSVYTYGDGTTSGFTAAWHQVKTSASTYLSGVSRLSHSQKGMMAIGSSNNIYVWGEMVWAGSASVASDNSYATQITTLPSVTPVDINIITRVEYIDGFAKYATQFILGNDGKIYGLGEGYRGILGQGNEADTTTWVAVRNPTNTGDLTNIQQISSNNTYVYKASPTNQNYYAMGALNSDGQLYMWGDNSLSMIGGSGTNYTLPTMPPNFNVNDARVGYFCMGGHTTLAFLTGSNRFCYVGHRTQGSMGDGTIASQTKTFYDCINTPNAYACPPPAPLGCAAASANDLLASSVNATVVINGQPAVTYWGQGSSSADAGQNVPLPLSLYEYNGTPKGVAASGVSVANGTQMWILSSAGLWGWGYSANTINTSVGVTSLSKMTLPAGVIIANVNFIRSSKGGIALVTVAGEVWIKAGAGSACSFTVYGDGSSALDNNWHQVTTAVTTPLTGITELSFAGTAAMAIGATGDVYAWGNSTCLGDGNGPSNRSRAALMTLHSDFTAIQIARKAEIIQAGANGAAQFLLGTNGKVYAVGGNLNGVLGIGNTTDQTSWSVLSLTNVTMLSSNNPFPNSTYSIGALTVTGTLYLWGSNANGVLGAGATTEYSSPVIPPLTPLGASVTAIDNVNGFEMGGQQTIIFTKPLAANPVNKFLFAGVNAGGAKGDITPAPATTTFATFTFGASVINCAGAVYNLSGNVYYDVNGLNDAGGGLISGTGITNVSGAPALYANLLDDAGNVVNSTPIGSNGTYAFSSLPSATYTIQIATTAGALFNPAPASGLTTAWAFIGEQLGTVAGIGINTGANAATGRMAVTLGSNISNINFGIEMRPVADAKTFTLSHRQFHGTNAPVTNFPVRGGYTSIAFADAALTGYAASANGSLSGSDPEDCATVGSCNSSSSRTFRIGNINTNTELWYYNGTSATQILTGQPITNFDVANLVIYGQDGTGTTANPLGFTYSLIDAASATSPAASFSINTGSIALPLLLSSFTTTLQPECTAAVNWTTVVEKGIAGYDVQHSPNGQGYTTIGHVTASGGANRTYSFQHHGISRGNNYYRLLIQRIDSQVLFSNTALVYASCLSNTPITILPNPTTGTLQITGLNAGDVVDIYTTVGLLSGTWLCNATGVFTTNISRMDAGLYILRVRDAGNNQIAVLRVSKF